MGHHPGALEGYLELDIVQAAVLQLTLLGQFPVGFYLKMSKLGAMHLSLEREAKLLGCFAWSARATIANVIGYGLTCY